MHQYPRQLHLTRRLGYRFTLLTGRMTYIYLGIMNHDTRASLTVKSTIVPLLGQNIDLQSQCFSPLQEIVHSFCRPTRRSA